MLGKLIKYELRATGRTFLPLYGAIIVVSLIQRLFGRTSGSLYEELNKIGGITTLILVALFMALAVITIIVTVQRFHKNLLSDEGYLMFTLPTKIRSLIASKLIVAVIWTIVSGIVGIISVSILFVTGEFVSMFAAGFGGFMQKLIEVMGTAEGQMAMWMCIQMMLATLLSYVQFILMIYLSLAIAQFPKFNKHRVASSFIAFFVINMLLSFGAGFIGFNINLDIQINNPNGIMLIANLIALALCAVFFEATNYILNRHLNLE